MSAKFFALLTVIGANKLAKATALGTTLKITQMAVGDGGGMLPTPDTQQTKLVGEKRRAGLNTLFVDPKNDSQIIAEQVIPENEGGYWIREIGLFDDEGSLIAVGNCPETYKPQLQEGSGRTQTIRMILTVSHTESVELKVDPSVILATREFVNDAIESASKSIFDNIEQEYPKKSELDKKLNITGGTLINNGKVLELRNSAISSLYIQGTDTDDNAKWRIGNTGASGILAIHNITDNTYVAIEGNSIKINGGTVATENYVESKIFASIAQSIGSSKIKSISQHAATQAFQPKGNYQPVGNYALIGFSYTKEESDGKYQPKGNYQAYGYSYSKSESDNKYQQKGNYQPAGNYALAGTSYTKAESDGKYQPKGNYQGSGYSYSKSESDNKYQSKGSYTTTTELSSGLSGKLNNSGGTLANNGKVLELKNTSDAPSRTALYIQGSKQNGDARWRVGNTGMDDSIAIHNVIGNTYIYIGNNGDVQINNQPIVTGVRLGALTSTPAPAGSVAQVPNGCISTGITKGLDGFVTHIPNRPLQYLIAGEWKTVEVFNG